MLTAVLRAATFVVIILICGVLLLTYLQPWLLASVTTAGRLGDIPSGCQTSERQTLTLIGLTITVTLSIVLTLLSLLTLLILLS